MSILIRFTVFLASVGAILSPVVQAQDIGKLAAASARVIAGDSAGSGVFITPEGVVVTAEHIITGHTGPFEIRRYRGPDVVATYTAKLLAVDAEHDIALLTADLEGETIHTLALARSEPTPPIIGAYCGYSSGKPRYEKITLHERSLLHFKSHGARLEPGDSGSPLVDAQTNIIGLAIGAENKSGHCLFVRLKHIREFLSTAKRKSRTSAAPGVSVDQAVRLQLEALNRELKAIRTN